MQRFTTRSRIKLMTAAAAAVLVGAGTAAPAAAAPDQQTERAAATVRASQTVVTWINGNVRVGPAVGYRIAYTVAPNQSLSAECWLVGGPVTANGISHDKWVLLSDGNYIWGGLLKGNEVGNVSRPCF